MSSTKRSNVRLSHAADYYITPVKDIELFLSSFNEAVKIDWKNDFILDPCAGGDSVNDMSYPQAIRNFIGAKPTGLDTIDIREDSRANKIADYLTYDVATAYQSNPSVIITNITCSGRSVSSVSARSLPMLSISDPTASNKAVLPPAI